MNKIILQKPEPKIKAKVDRIVAELESCDEIAWVEVHYWDDLNVMFETQARRESSRINEGRLL